MNIAIQKDLPTTCHAGIEGTSTTLLVLNPRIAEK